MGLAYQDLTKPERAVWRASRSGKLVDLRACKPGRPELDDPATATAWDATRVIRAQLLVALLTGTSMPKGAPARAVRLQGARITGTLDLEAATLVCPILLRGCYVERPINLKEARASSVRLPGCRLPGLLAEQLEVRGNLELTHGFAAHGEVCLLGARIGGQLYCDGSTLDNPDGRALNADGLVTGRGVFLRAGFRARGEVNLIGARIGGALDCSSGSFSNPGRPALNADRLVVEQSVFLRAGFRAHGEVRLLGARIGGQLYCDGSTFGNPDGAALRLEGLRAAALILLPQHAPNGLVDLTNAQVCAFHDDTTTWPSTLRLGGFTYEALENSGIDVRSRLRWLERDPDGYRPQMYEQLGAAYRRAGQDQAACRVAIAKQWRRRQSLSPPGRLWNWFMYLTIGYGYRCWLAGIWLLALTVVGTCIFSHAHPAHMVAARHPAPIFQPIIYTLDLLLPVVSLGQQGAWIPREAALWWSFGFVLAGWLLTTAVVAGLTGVLRRA